MLLIKLSFITRINSIGCELPLLGGRGVLYFSEWTHNSKSITHNRLSPLTLFHKIYHQLNVFYRNARYQSMAQVEDPF